MESINRNNNVAFALKSMMFEPYTHIVMRRRSSSGSLYPVGGAYGPAEIIKRYGSCELIRSVVAGDVLLIEIK